MLFGLQVRNSFYAFNHVYCVENCLNELSIGGLLHRVARFVYEVNRELCFGNPPLMGLVVNPWRSQLVTLPKGLFHIGEVELDHLGGHRGPHVLADLSVLGIRVKQLI